MLKNFFEIDYVMYKQLSNIKKKISHAYLFNLNDNIYAEDFIFSFICEILCETHNYQEEFNQCLKCKQILNRNYDDLKIIKPDNNVIKKDQIDELQSSFSKSSLIGNKRVYVIYDVEKLNLSAANSLLKFLEEPTDGIIAILLTNNINIVLKTITSRCQILNFKKNNLNDLIKYYNINENLTYYKLLFVIWKKNKFDEMDAEKNNLIINSVSFIKYLEKNKLKSIVFIKNKFYDIFKTKEEIDVFFKCVILFYNDVISYKINNKILYFDDYEKEIKDSSNIDFNILFKKLKLLIQKEKLIEKNINLNLLMDGLIIDMEGIEND